MKNPLHTLPKFGAIVIACNLSFAVADEPVIKPAESVKPGINKNFLDPNLKVSDWVEKFEVESREVFSSRVQIMKALDLKKGEAVADIGAGTGLFMVAMSNGVGDEGKVYSVDISEAFVKNLKERVAELKLTNVTPVLCDQDDAKLPEASVDAAFICDTYHHFEFPQSTLKSIFKALKPGGRLVVVDFERIPGESSEWTMGHVRAGKETFAAEIEAAGFKNQREVEVPGLKENYCLEFRKPE
ncbi:MAG: methyltransferase domain-containing protein [Verrucomicrobiales bacterium]